MKRTSLRLPEYDYSQAGRYFVKICTHEKKCIFGKVEEGKMQLNELGKIVEKNWNKTLEMRENISLDAFIVMPNHIHGVITFTNNLRGNVGANCHSPKNDRAYSNTPLQSPSNTLGAIIRGFKSATTKEINIFRATPKVPVWQRNYYEHVIRNDESFEKIYEYILTNPLCWEKDRFFSFDDYEF